MNNALLSSKNMNWCTPQDFFDRLNDEFLFTLDAAATAKSAKCKQYFTPETDGLKQSWNRGGGCFLQSAVRPSAGRVGRKGIQRIKNRDNDRSAYSGPNGYIILSRFYIRESRNTLYPRTPKIHRRRRERTNRRKRTQYARAVSVNGCYI